MCMSTVKFRHYFLNMTRVVRTNDLNYRNVEIVSAIVNIWGHIFILIITINPNVKRRREGEAEGRKRRKTHAGTQHRTEDPRVQRAPWSTDHQDTSWKTISLTHSVTHIPVSDLDNTKCARGIWSLKGP